MTDSKFEDCSVSMTLALVLSILVVASAGTVAAQTPTHSGNWENTEIHFGLNTNHGNTDSISLTAQADWDAQAGLTETDMDFDSSFNKASGTEFIDSQKLDWALRRSFAANSRWFALLHNWIEHHESAGINLRVTVGPGLGYHIFDTTKSRLTTEGGIGRTKEEHDGTGVKDTFTVGFLDTTWNRTISDRTSLDHKTSLTWNIDDTDDFRAHSESDLEVQFNKVVGLKTGVTIDYDQRPVPNHEKTDLSTHTALTIKFGGKG